MGKWTVKLLQRIEPEVRLRWAADLFWITILLGILSVLFICNSGFERVLMAISWGAISITCVDVVCTTDVRDNEGG
jgi:hypothetical protein